MSVDVCIRGTYTGHTLRPVRWCLYVALGHIVFDNRQSVFCNAYSSDERLLADISKRRTKFFITWLCVGNDNAETTGKLL